MPATPKNKVQNEILKLAEKHHVVYKVGPRDAFAKDMSRLAGDEVRLDATGHLIVALQRAGVITRKKAVLLQAQYMRQAIS